MSGPSISAHADSAASAATGRVSDGATLTFETVGTFPGGTAPVRVHPHEASLLRVIDGVVRLTTGTVERLLGSGDEAIVEAGQPHRIAGVGGEARYVVGFRSAPLL
jgi:quercetin dioxygenase-like cupin family protein